MTGRARVGALLVGAVLALVAWSGAPGAARGGGSGEGDPAEPAGIDVVQVEGLFDPFNVTLVRDAIADANDRGSTVLVLQIDSGGAVDVDVSDVVDDILASEVPVVAWVGPSGSGARGAIALLLEAAHVASASPGSSLGPASPVRFDEPGDPGRKAVARRLARLAERQGRDVAGARRIEHDRLSAGDALDVGAINLIEPTVGELIVSLDGRIVSTADGPRVLSTARVIGEGLDRRRQPNQDVRFNRLSLDAQLLHTLSTPSVAYFLFVVGLALIVFEFYTAAIGLAGLVGAAALVGGLYGFSHLPVQPWAAALLALAVIGYAVDVQAGRPAAWTVIGSFALVAGSLGLYGGSSRLDPPWWVLLLVGLGLALFMLGAMPTMIRSRFSTPTVGREGMIGETGRAEVEVTPDGVVMIQGARWRARTNRATPIAEGAEVRVVAVEGLVLEVEPESGGARDYRDRRAP